MSNPIKPDFEGAKAYAVKRLEEGLDPALTYHCLAHTKDDIVPAVTRFAELESVTGEDLLMLLTAAWFHDIGFIYQRENHEDASVKVIHQILPMFGYSFAQIEVMSGIIMATKLPQTPHNLLEEIMADADLDSLGRDDFLEISENLRSELQLFGRTFSDPDWYRFELGFLQSHSYFTRAARQLRNAGKQKNIELMSQLLKQLTE
jgi:uncharacterized protein